MIVVGAATFFRQRAASRPSITGIIMSRTSTSGLRRNVASMACSPFSTEPITSNWGSKSRETARRICSLSSANKIRGLFNVQDWFLTVEIAALRLIRRCSSRWEDDGTGENTARTRHCGGDENTADSKTTGTQATRRCSTAIRRNRTQRTFILKPLCRRLLILPVAQYVLMV